ncbi:unnamed protein product [Urochloa humidicola]
MPRCPIPWLPLSPTKCPIRWLPRPLRPVVVLTLALAVLLAPAYFASSVADRVRASDGQDAPPAGVTVGEANARRLPQKHPAPAGDGGAEVKYRVIHGRDPGPSAEDSDPGPYLRL